MTAKTLMLQGASSSVGKSLLAAALCRIYARRGLRVAPFKAQNMSNNAAVCMDGSEIGRAQALQAAAAGIPPSADMNPILIKPEADMRSQVILMGHPWDTMAAKTYYEKKSILWKTARAALDRLRAQADLVIIEGAGSPAELNLKSGDIVNMAIARYVRSPVLLIGDIDRGGIFAQLLGTLWLLEPEEQTLVRGLLVNKFRGDIGLFKDGIQILEQKGKVPVLGVIPYLKDLSLPDEDAVSVEMSSTVLPLGAGGIDIAIIHLPHIANFDDFDPLRSETGVNLRYVRSTVEFGSPQAVLLPGTKSTMADLEWLKQTGLASAVRQFADNGRAVVGICGGYQMLGSDIFGTAQVESNTAHCEGIGLLQMETHFLPEKSTFLTRAEIQADFGWMKTIDGQQVKGYEIHMGKTVVSGKSWLNIVEHNRQPVKLPDGAAGEDGRIWGCYLHGIFGNDAFRHAWLKSLGWKGTGTNQAQLFMDALDRLADTVESSLNMQALDMIIQDND